MTKPIPQSRQDRIKAALTAFNKGDLMMANFLALNIGIEDGHQPFEERHCPFKEPVLADGWEQGKTLAQDNDRANAQPEFNYRSPS